MKAAMILFFSLPLSLTIDAQAKEAVAENACVGCHTKTSPGLVLQWQKSEHAKQGVACLDCHGADEKDPDGFLHEGVRVATLVTPKDCAECHEQEAAQVQKSYHATAGEILESKDAYLAHAAGGHPAAIAGCENCHGSKVKIDDKSPNKLHIDSWPNSGIGRLNPDGSKGACTACHTRHQFDRAQARKPEACGKCHLGPDHPQKEIYEESKHGNAYYTHLNEMNMNSDEWIVGKDYFAAPTCATCHMSQSPRVARTHDVGARISWTLRPPVSKMKPDWQAKRKNMKGVCQACHGSRFIDGHYRQFDGLVQLYNEKFAIPAGEIMALVKKRKVMKNKAAFSNKIEWIYWELWHHEGRRARHGAAMMGPDYTWWHGIYEVAQHFYFKFLPAARAYKDKRINRAIDKLLKKNPMHTWIKRPTEQIKKDIRSGKEQKKYEQLFKPGAE
jgi:hydroxylamine dehydrogenase